MTRCGIKTLVHLSQRGHLANCGLVPEHNDTGYPEGMEREKRSRCT